MSANPILKPVASAWGSFDVFIVPDDDDEARLDGWTDEFLSLATQEHAALDGRRLFVRASLWSRIRAEFSALGTMH